jgi:hypothetical protein
VHWDVPASLEGYYQVKPWMPPVCQRGFINTIPCAWAVFQGHAQGKSWRLSRLQLLHPHIVTGTVMRKQQQLLIFVQPCQKMCSSPPWGQAGMHVHVFMVPCRSQGVQGVMGSQVKQ